jgi:hypothetical protein
MLQSIHIFKKDVRHLRFEIAIAISVVAAFAFIEARRALWLVDPTNNRTAASVLIMFLLPLAWWTLIGRAIHDEALPGDRQFWITRPYSWRGLLGAKILFILAFINLPMLVADAVIVHAYGLPLGPALPGLLWSQILLTVVFLLPIFALSALTNGFVQLIVTILAPCVIALLLAIISPGAVLYPGVAFGRFAGASTGGYEWINFYILYLVISVGGSAILLWQYTRRGTFLARCLAAATAILAVVGVVCIPWSAAFRIQSWLSHERVDLSAARADYDLNDKSLTRAVHIGDQMRIELPLQVTGLPPDASVQVEGFSAQFDAPDGSMRRVVQLPEQTFVEMGQHFSLRSYVDNTFYKQVKDEPLTVRGELYLTLFGNRQATPVPFGNSSVLVPRVGVCSASQTETTSRRNYFVTCSSAFRNPPALVSYRLLESATGISKRAFPFAQRRRVSYSPFPADVGISPVNQDFEFTSGSAPWEEAVVGTMEPLGHIRLNFEINSLRLGDFEVFSMPPQLIFVTPSPAKTPGK